MTDLIRLILFVLALILSGPAYSQSKKGVPYVKIEGSDGLTRAKVDYENRLWSNSVFPEGNYFSTYLTNGSTINMNVNGATVNVNYDYTATETIKYVESLTMYISDNANFDESQFGAVAGLANGVQITYRSKGQVRTLNNLQNNIDIFMSFRENHFSDVDSGLLGTSRLYTGGIRFQQRIALDPSQGDYIRVTIRDNLTGLVQLRFVVRVWEFNG